MKLAGKKNQPEGEEMPGRRDRKAFERLVYEHTAMVYGCISRIVRNEDEVKNLVQETFYQAYVGITNFRGDSKISTWLCSIAINLARAHLRKNRHLDTYEDVEQLQPVFDERGGFKVQVPSWDPHRVTEENDTTQKINAAIDSLPPDYRMVVVLRDVHEFSTAEVARMLGISEGAVRVRLHRARQALRGMLDGYFR